MSLVWESVRVTALSNWYLGTNLSSPEAVAITGSKHIARFRRAGKQTQKHSSSHSFQYTSSSATFSPASSNSPPRLLSKRVLFLHHVLFWIFSFPLFFISTSFSLFFCFRLSVFAYLLPLVLPRICSTLCFSFSANSSAFLSPPFN